MSLIKRGKIWSYEFVFAGRRIRESAKTTSKTVAKLAEQQRRRELEKGFNGIEDNRDDRIRSVAELASEYLEEYRLRHKAFTFAESFSSSVLTLINSKLRMSNLRAVVTNSGNSATQGPHQVAQTSITPSGT